MGIKITTLLYIETAEIKGDSKYKNFKNTKHIYNIALSRDISNLYNFFYDIWHC